MDPVIFVVRPTAVCPPTPTSCSWTRYPAKEAVPSSIEPSEPLTFQVPSIEAGAVIETDGIAGGAESTETGELGPTRMYQRP
jgi:hypothetical protein